MILRREAGTFFEFCHIFINTYCLKWFIKVIHDSNFMIFFCFALFFVVGKVIVWKDYLLSWSCKGILKANVTYKMITIPKHWYAWQFVYSNDVIETNEEFHFLGIGKNLSPVLLRIEVDLLNNYLNQKIKINNLFIISKAEALSSNWLLTLTSRKQHSWECGERNIAFLCDRGTFLWLISSFCLPLVL